jgi:hypothetical protein
MLLLSALGGIHQHLAGLFIPVSDKFTAGPYLLIFPILLRSTSNLVEGTAYPPGI